MIPPVLATAASGFKFWFNWMLLPSAAVKMRPLPPVAAVTPPSWVEKLLIAETRFAAVRVPEVAFNTVTPLTASE